jgi:pSer/pThr/pTyr-binding forkhead associated (FHA) protein
MSTSTELLVLRLALIGVIFLFVIIAAATMKNGVRITNVVTAARTRTAGSKLVLVDPADTGLAPGIEFNVAGSMSLGRNSSSSIVLHDPSVSGLHASLEQTRGGWQLLDLGSTNGTFVNGQPIDGRGVLLRGGEQINLGAVTLRFQA